MAKTAKPLDVWLKFAPLTPEQAADYTLEDDEAEYEANCYRLVGGGIRVEWCHTAVGQVSHRDFPDHKSAQEWLTSEGFQDFSS